MQAKRGRSASCPAAITSERRSRSSTESASVGQLVWPPPVDWAAKYGIAAVGLIAIPAALATYLSSTAQHGGTRMQWHSEELARRLKKLDELTNRARRSLQSRELTARVRSRDLREACQDVVQMSPSHDALAEGLLVTCQLIELELPEVTERTANAEDEEFRDGTQLADHVRNLEALRSCADRCRMAPHMHAVVWQKVKQVLLLGRVAERTLRILRNEDLGKAVRLIWIVRKHLPLIGLSTMLSTIAGVLRTAEVYYKAESLEVFRDPMWTWGVFRKTAWALAMTKMLVMLLDIVKDRMHASGEMSMANELRMKMYQSLLKKDLEWYRIGQKDERNTEQLLNDIYCLPGDMHSILAVPRQLIEDLVNIITQAIIVRRRSSALLYALIAIQWSGAAVQAGVDALRNRLVQDVIASNPEPDAKSFVEPLLTENLPTIRSFNYEDKAAISWGAYWENDSTKERKLRAIRGVFRPLMDSLEEGASLAERGWCGHLIQDGRLHVGEMMNLQSYAQDVSHSIKQVPPLVLSVRDKLRPLAKAWDLLQAGFSIKSGNFIPLDQHGRHACASGHLSFEHVKFSYPDGTTVLRDVSFEVQAGMFVGVTGSSGGGKSTFFKLLERLYDPVGGTIKLDGRNIQDYDIHWLRRQIGLIPQGQDIRLLTMTLWENLTIGCEIDPTEAEVREACQAACIWDELIRDGNRLPNGLYTHVTADRFSGGELQRIAIARALLIQSPILLLDEATSALDAETQRKVQTALSKLLPRRTLLVIAHRLETIRHADKIICFHAGFVAEEGTHDMLLNRTNEVSIKYSSQDDFHEDVTTSVHSSRHFVSYVQKGGFADVRAVRLGFEAFPIGSGPGGYIVTFRGPGVYAELSQRPSPSPTSEATGTMTDYGSFLQWKKQFLEKLRRADEAIAASIRGHAQNPRLDVNDETERVVAEESRVALLEVRDALLNFSTAEKTGGDLPKSRL